MEIVIYIYHRYINISFTCSLLLTVSCHMVSLTDWNSMKDWDHAVNNITEMK